MNKRLIYAEGRNNISPFMADDVKRATIKKGWTFRQLFSVGVDDFFDEGKMEEIFPKDASVFLRNLPQNTNGDIAKLVVYFKKNKNTTINFNAVGGLEAANDKQFQQFLLTLNEKTRKYVIPSYEVANKSDVKVLVKRKKIKYPFLLKPRDGSIGKGIRLIEKENDLDSQSRWNFMVAQNYIDSDYDWRVYVVGGVAVGALRRGGKDLKPGNFEAFANGITKEREKDVEVLKAINKVACEVTAVAGLEYGGCDIIRDKNSGEYYILEVNTAATWEGGYADIIKVDLASEILEWCDERMSAKRIDIRIKHYINNRLDALSQLSKDNYKKILNWEWDGESDSKNDMTIRLVDTYKKLKNGDSDGTAKYILEEVERKPLCWAGNFIGSDKWGEDGVLEESIIPSACYLAIREKYDKIVGVNKGKL